MSDYDRIAQAIEFITDHAEEQPSLDDVAKHLNLSPSHFQRLFSRWTGVTPKRYLQILTVEHAKKLLAESKPLLDVSNTIGLSSGSRLYDHFVQLEAVTPGEFKKAGQGLEILYGSHDTLFGRVFIAITSRGICKLSFVDEISDESHIAALAKQWPFATIKLNDAATKEYIQTIFDRDSYKSNQPLSVHVKGTNFQVSVWKALLQIPFASLTSYNEIAKSIGKPKAARAIGQAVGANPVAFIIPCHRVIQQSGQIGGYHWGLTRKHAMHAWELAEKD